MGEVSKDLIKEKESQTKGLERLFETLFGEYFEKHHEYPPLYSGNIIEDTRRVNHFIGSRPDVLRSIQGLPAVQSMVVEVAIKVLKKMMGKE
jgi:hypothetical protein